MEFNTIDINADNENQRLIMAGIAGLIEEGHQPRDIAGLVRRIAQQIPNQDQGDRECDHRAS